MPTSLTTPLYKPGGEDLVPPSDMAYMRARGRQQAFNLLHTTLKASGISQATLARRTGKPPEVISRLFSRPSNIEQDTLSELIFAMTGGGITHSIEYPTASSVQRNPVIDSTTTSATVDLSPKPYQHAEAA
jgi:Helix-turn-helix